MYHRHILPYPAIQFYSINKGGRQENTGSTITDFPLALDSHFRPQSPDIQLHYSKINVKILNPKAKGLCPNPQDYEGSKTGIFCLILHLPRHIGVQEALEFLDIGVGRILHLKSFLKGKHTRMHAETQGSWRLLRKEMPTVFSLRERGLQLSLSII